MHEASSLHNRKIHAAVFDTGQLEDVMAEGPSSRPPVLSMGHPPARSMGLPREWEGALTCRRQRG